MKILIFAAMALGLAAPAAAKEYRIAGANPAPTIAVQAGDTLVLAKPIGRELKQDGSLDKTFSAWIDRGNGKGWKLAGATRLKLVGLVTGKGYVYAPIDAVPAPVIDVPTSQPVIVPEAPVMAPGSQPVRWGINVSGGEFKGVEGGALLPSPTELQAYYDAGFRLFRIPFKMTQVQTAPAKLAALGAKCVQLGVPCILNRHEYDWRKVPNSIPEWKALLALMPVSDLIQIGPMNEPAYFDSLLITNDYDQFAIEGQKFITDMRAAGITNRIWLGGPQSSAAYRFFKGEISGKGCESIICSIRKLPGGTIKDPLGKTGLEAHRYPDKNGSGVNDYCYPYTDIATAAAYGKSVGLPVFVGEMAFGSNRGFRDTCLAFGKKAIEEARTSGLYGVTWWGGGKAWNSKYLFFTPPIAALPYVKMITGK